MRIGAPLVFAAAAGCLLCALYSAYGEAAPAESRSISTAGQDPAESINRPTDIRRWITLGTTLRMRLDAPEVLDEMRHIQVDPRAYEGLLAEGAFPDGTAFAVTFYSLKAVETETPVLYAADTERFFALEILDQDHPDGRRFYQFPPGVDSATALPPGNQCAACHNANGKTQGIFAQHYPVMKALSDA